MQAHRLIVVTISTTFAISKSKFILLLLMVTTIFTFVTKYTTSSSLCQIYFVFNRKMWYILTTMKLPNWTCILIIVILGSLVYANSLGGEFIWDDLSFIRDNAFLKDWSNVPHIFTETATTSMDVGGGSVRYNLYRPLQWLTFMADYSVWKLNPLGYHLTNIFLHISAALILFWFIALLFRSRMLSFLTALFFVIHPVHTEAVAYISGRADPLGLIFMLSSFGFYIKYTND